MRLRASIPSDNRTCPSSLDKVGCGGLILGGKMKRIVMLFVSCSVGLACSSETEPSGSGGSTSATSSTSSAVSSTASASSSSSATGGGTGGTGVGGTGGIGGMGGTAGMGGTGGGMGGMGGGSPANCTVLQENIYAKLLSAQKC